MFKKSHKPTKFPSPKTSLSSQFFLKGKISYQSILDNQLDIEDKIKYVTDLIRQQQINKAEQLLVLKYLASLHQVFSDWLKGTYNISFEIPPKDFDPAQLYITQSSNKKNIQCTLKSHILNQSVTTVIPKQTLDIMENEIPSQLSKLQYAKLIKILSDAGHSLSEKDACNESLLHINRAIAIIRAAIELTKTNKEETAELTGCLNNYLNEQVLIETTYFNLLTEEQVQQEKYLKEDAAETLATIRYGK